MASQTISNRYVKLQDLRNLLRTKFGAGQFKIEETNESYLITVPTLLTEVMADLRNRIERIRFSFSNTENRKFVPEAALFDAITESAVKQSLKELKVPIHEINDIINDILQGARKCFAILLVIGRGEAVTNFIKHDSLQQSTPDSRLPYTSEQLRHIFEGEDKDFTVESFFERQWEFAIPIMQKHTIFRELHTSAILPFRHKEFVGRGSMGDAWKVELYPQCHLLPLKNHTAVRKEIICQGDSGKVAFQKELENLALLTNLKHKNIVELYCAYTYQHRYNLVFAPADGGSLEEILNGTSTKGPKSLQCLLAVAELASAIDAFHNFTSEALDLELSGCHHDLAPRNILIHEGTFLLADFGLSSLRNADEDSLTLFKDVRGSYLAPECQLLQDGEFIKGQISRASDIWSFGCILSEILTYLKLGSDGVMQFRNERKIDVTSDVTWPRFHQGPGRVNPAIEPWLNDLQAGEDSYNVRITRLIRKMLAMNPKERPSSADVLMALRGIWIVSFGQSIELALEDMCKAHSAIDCTLNRIRFGAWLLAFRQLLDAGYYKEPSSPIFDFSKVVHALKETYRILSGSPDMTNSVRHQQQSLLRYQHAQLTEAFPTLYRDIARGHFERLLLQGDDAEQLGNLSTAVKADGDEDVGVLIAVKHLTVLANKGHLIDRDDLVIRQNDVVLDGDVDIHTMARLGPESELVLVEWLKYKGSWADEATGLELRGRLMSVIELLHAENTARIPGSLHCRGMFHDPSHRAFGVAYDLPPPKEKPITLYGLLDAPKSPYRPLLEYRFQLAFDICQCIYTFHKVGWLHRNLHSMNVVFFPSRDADKAQWAKEPRIVGFAGSRESGLNSFTHGPEDVAQLRNYQHPEYLTRQERYREIYDYYSIGILLLEIGLWSTLAEITSSSRFEDLSDDQYRQELVKNRVPRLGIYMGTRYMEAVRICLDGGLAINENGSESEREASYTAFKELVMDKVSMMRYG